METPPVPPMPGKPMSFAEALTLLLTSVTSAVIAVHALIEMGRRNRKAANPGLTSIPPAEKTGF